jgi:hypothetical protein
VPGADASASRIRRRALSLAIVALLGAAAVAGVLALAHAARGSAGRAQAVASAGADAGELRVTRDFGATTLAERREHIPASSTAMSVLAANAKVDTAYGGAFVNSIDGLASGFTGSGGMRADWFYFVNGFQANRGAADYSVSGADRVWWDYHRWDFAPSVPAVVGQFPQPFLSGAERKLPTVVEYADGFSAPAGAVAAALRGAGVARVSAAPMAPGAALSGDRHVVLVGTWTQLTRIADIASAAEHPASSGLFARFEAGRLVTLDSLGRASAQDQPAGAVLATARAAEPDAAIWLVTGGDAADVASAAALLRAPASALAGRFGVAVLRDHTLIALPTKPGS